MFVTFAAIFSLIRKNQSDMKSYIQSLIVDKNQTASSLGSGSLDVFATPALVAFMENTAVKALDDLGEGMTTVGTVINVRHLKASKIGEKMTCTATLIHQEGRRYEFEITVTDSTGELTATATHERAAVDVERFLRKLNAGKDE